MKVDMLKLLVQNVTQRYAQQIILHYSKKQIISFTSLIQLNKGYQNSQLLFIRSRYNNEILTNINLYNQMQVICSSHFYPLPIPLISTIIQSNLSPLLRNTTSVVTISCSVVYSKAGVIVVGRYELLWLSCTPMYRLDWYLTTNSNIQLLYRFRKFYNISRLLSQTKYRCFPNHITLCCGSQWICSGSQVTPKQTLQTSEMYIQSLRYAVQGKMKFLSGSNFLVGCFIFSRYPKACRCSRRWSSYQVSWGVVADLMQFMLLSTTASTRFVYIAVSRGKKVLPKLRVAIFVQRKDFILEGNDYVKGSMPKILLTCFICQDYLWHQRERRYSSKQDTKIVYFYDG